MEQRTVLNLYFDFYGSLLTNKQQQIFKLYFEDDLSLAEIAEETQVTRQAVHDNLQRSEKQLLYFEKQLALAEKFLKQKNDIMQAYALLKNNSKSENIEKACLILQQVLLEENADLL